MTGPRTNSREAIEGFTLLEALVAMALMGLILMALATVTGQWLPHWKHGFNRLQSDEQIAIATDRLAFDLSAAEFVSANKDTHIPVFDGTSRSITFVRNAFGPHSDPGLDIVRISEVSGKEGLILVRMRAPFRPIANDDPQRPKFIGPVVLLRPPYRISFSYAGPDRSWRNNWHLEPRLPEAIRLTLHNGASDQGIIINTATLVHAQMPVDCLKAKSVDGCFDSRQRAPKPARNNIPHQ